MLDRNPVVEVVQGIVIALANAKAHMRCGQPVIQRKKHLVGVVCGDENWLGC